MYTHTSLQLVFPSAAASVIAAANPAVTTTKDMGNPWPNCLNVFFTVLVNGEYTVEFLMIHTKYQFQLYELIRVCKLPTIPITGERGGV